MYPMPAVAISMPIGAWHPLLPAALRSLTLQDVDIELAIFDASGDDRVVQAIAASGLQPRIHHTGPDGGQSAAIAKGWAQTQAPFVGWLNADDVLMPGALARLLERLQADPHLAVAYGGSTILGDDGETLGLQDQVTDVDAGITRSNPISQPSALARRSAAETAGGLHPDLVYTMDWDLWLRIYQSGGRFERLDDVLSAVYWGCGTKTAEVSLARLSELYTLTRQASGHWAAMKTSISSALQTRWPHLAIQSPLRSAPQSSTPDGLRIAASRTPSELPCQTAKLPVLNTGNSLARELRVVTQGPCRVRAGQAQVLIEETGESEHVLAVEVKAGGTCMLELEVTAGAARFISARLAC